MKSKYHTNVAPFLNEAAQMIKDGASEEEIAKRLGVAYSTFRRYKEEHEELAKVLSKAKQFANDEDEADKYEKIKKEPVLNHPPAYSSAPSSVKRPDRDGVHRGAFNRARARIYATQTVCGICGKPVDFSLKYPHPLSPCIDHIIPISKGGHPSDMSNLQLAHWTCNRQKSDKLIETKGIRTEHKEIGNRVLPQSIDWSKYKGV